MDKLIKITRDALDSRQDLPFSIYTCKSSQLLRGVPILKPVVVFVLKGAKHLAGEMNSVCKQGSFVFLAENREVSISNIPAGDDYLALFIEFEYSDFEPAASTTNSRHLIGEMSSALVQCITQFIEWSHVAPKEMWSIRRKELIKLLCYQGYKEILSLVEKPKINHQLIDVFREDPSVRWSIDDVSKKLAMSESTLRRKLQAEGASFRDLNLQVRLGHGMHLLQTTNLAISQISEQCGYQSQSRFSEMFRVRFGLTPSQLRQSKREELGEILSV